MNTKQDLQQGVSLVELLVSMVVTLIVLGGVISVVTTSRSTFINEQEASFMQENARFAMEMLARDVRMAGSKGCAPDSGTWYVDAIDLDGLYGIDGIEGFEADATPIGGPAGVDAVVVRYADPNGAIPITGHVVSSGSNLFSTASATGFSNGEKLFVVDASCRHYAYFEATTASANAANVTQGSSGNNCQVRLLAEIDDSDCSRASPSARPYRPGSQIMPFYIAGYFVDDSVVIAGVPALKRRVFTASGQRTEELAQGVESMEVVYGVDESFDPAEELEVEVYLSASEVTNWQAVSSVRFVLVLRSQSEFFDSDRAVTLNDTDYNDRFLRQLVTTTVQIRNRG